MNTTRRTSIRPSLLLVCILLGAGFASSSTSRARSCSPASAENATAAAGFDKLKSLAGTWESTTSGMGKVTSSFQVTSGGTAVLERLSSPTDKDMITIYTLDGNRVLLTHYCHTGNQPRMQAASFDSKTNQIEFTFLDATGLLSANDPHMHQAVFKFTSANQITENWSFYKDGKAAMVVSITFHRVS
ncbi:MAG: hypothetical protein WA823_10680 [Candidatus Acidiferrales bacterium]